METIFVCGVAVVLELRQAITPFLVDELNHSALLFESPLGIYRRRVRILYRLDLGLRVGLSSEEIVHLRGLASFITTFVFRSLLLR